jgi:VWFA-related protein
MNWSKVGAAEGNGCSVGRDITVPSMGRRLATTLLCFLVGTVAVRSEDPRPAFRESAEVTLVEVPVNVLGRDGKPVRGLGLADFELEDDGVRQRITSVDVVDLTKKAVGSSLPSELPAAGRRHFLLLFDLSFSTAAQIVRARDAATLFLDTAMAPDDLAAVATTSVDQGARVLVTFTADRRQLAAAIRKLGLPRREERGVDPLSFVLVVPGDPFLSQNPSTAAAERAVGANPIDPGAARVYSIMARKGADNYSETRVRQHLGEMSSLASALNAVEGRKTIVYFSEGFDSRLLLGSLAHERSREETLADNDAILDGRLWALDVDRRSANTPLQRQLNETLTIFRRSDCVVYPIDIGGQKADGDVSLGARHGEEALFAFANGTGGELIRGGNDLSSQLRRVADKTSLTYVLTFRPTKVLGEGEFHDLKVRVRTKGARVSARAGYYETRLFRTLSPLERALSAADVITHEKKDGDFSLDVLAMALNEEPMNRVPVLLEVPGRELLAKAPAARLTLGLYVYAVDEEGQLADFFSRSVGIDLSRDGPRLRDGAFRYYGILRLSPGKYRIRSFVRDEERGRFGFRVVSLDVPAPESGALRALPPLFVAAEGPGISLRDQTGREGSVSEPFELAGDSFVPQVRPRLAAGKSTRLCLLIYSAGAAAAGPLMRLEARIRDEQGHSFEPAQFSVIGRTAPDSKGLWKLLVEFAPQALPSGDYSLLVTLRDSAGKGATAETEAPFKIL